MGVIADKLMDWIQSNVPEAMQVAGDTQIEETREGISEPYPPASLPFHRPHRRKGLLMEGLHIEREVDASAIRDTFVGGRQAEPGHIGVPELLEQGTPKMDSRPYVGEMRERIIATYLDNVVSDLRTRLLR